MTSDTTSDHPPVSARARLDASRAALLAALEGLTEREFGTEISGGETVLDRLQALATRERETTRAARQRLGAGERPTPASGRGITSGRVLPPQAIHDLAGARYETALLIEAAASRLREIGDDLASIAENELAAAAAIVASRGSRSSSEDSMHRA